MTDCKIQGSCYCGKIEFSASKLSDWAGNCHCSQCQKIHGAPFVTWYGFHEEGVKINDTENQLSSYNAGHADRSFCKNCGTHFMFQYTDNSRAPKGGDWLPFICFTKNSIRAKLPDIDLVDIHLDK